MILKHLHTQTTSHKPAFTYHYIIDTYYDKYIQSVSEKKDTPAVIWRTFTIK